MISAQSRLLSSFESTKPANITIVYRYVTNSITIRRAGTYTESMTLLLERGPKGRDILTSASEKTTGFELSCINAPYYGAEHGAEHNP